MYIYNKLSNMQLEIITIGDEILIGQIVDTNSAWMARKLNAIGIHVQQITTVSDNEEAILKALSEASLRVDIVLITGGLGPTKDDITKRTLCKFFNTKLQLNEQVYEHIKNIFKARGIFDVKEINKRQAEVPVNCQVLFNALGTAPGMWFEEGDKIFVSMPGVPFEMEALMTNAVLPRLKSVFKLPHILHKTILTQGIGESFLAELIADWEDGLPDNIKLAYLPSAGLVKIRLSGVGEDLPTLQRQMEFQLQKVQEIAGPYIYGYDEDTLESILGKLLKQQGKTLVTAESCTGGYIAHKITSVPGCSDYFKGALIAYSNSIKEDFCGVAKDILMNHGAVSEATALEMARATQISMKADCVIACTGIAGPGGGSDEKPVGTTWIAVANGTKIQAAHFLFGNNRERNIQRASQTGLNMLIRELKGGI
jgi:nicotinamide-nucleotide amidase